MRRSRRRTSTSSRTGDTLGAIAERTGVPVERLQELNPSLDPQALVSGPEDQAAMSLATPRRRLAPLVAALSAAASPPRRADAARAPPIGAPSAIVVDAAHGEVLYARRARRRARDREHDEADDRAADARARRRRPTSSRAPPTTRGRDRVEDRPAHRRADDASRDLLARAAARERQRRRGDARRWTSPARAAAFVRRDERARAPSSASTTRSYANPIGLDDPGNYSTARDLAALARVLLRDRRASRAIVDMPRGRAAQRRAAARASPTATRWSARTPFVDGVKTGHTRRRRLRARRLGRAGAARRSSASCSASRARRRATPTASRCCARASRQFRARDDRARGAALCRAAVRWHSTAAKVDLVATRDVTLTVRRGERVRTPRSTRRRSSRARCRRAAASGTVDVVQRRARGAACRSSPPSPVPRPASSARRRRRSADRCRL